MNERVLILRDAVVKITQMLSGKGINVTQRGVSASVQCDANGRPAVVNLPYLPDNATEELCSAIQGFLDHEVAHILFSDFALFARAKKEGCFSMLNILEDARIEKEMAKKFAGCGHNLSVTGKFYLDKYATPMMQEAAAAGDANKVIGVLMVPLIRAMSGQQVFREYIADKMHIVQGVHDKIADLQPAIEGAASTQACFDLAKEIEKRIREGDKGDGKSEKPSADNGESSVEVKDAGKGEKSEDKEEKKKKKSKGSKKDDADSEEKSESEGEGSASTSEGKDGDEDDKAEGDSSSEDEDSGSKSEDEDEGEKSVSGAKDKEGEGEGEGGGEGGGSSESDDEEEEDAGDSEIESGSASATWDAIDKEGANSFDDAVSSAISNSAITAAKDADYLIYTKEFDVVEPLKVGSEYRDHMLMSLSDRVDHMVGPLQKDLERAIAARSLSTWESGRRSGRLHAANLSRLAVGDPRVFRKRHESTSKDVAVELVVDASGSMRGAKVHLAVQSAYALSQVLERIGINHEVLCFTTGPVEGDPSALAEETRKIGRQFTRSEGLYMPILKGFNERLNADVKKRFGWLPNSRIMRNNIDGECIEIALRRLLSRREAGKVMIVLSDGAPNAYGDSYAMQIHLKQVVKDVAARGVNVVGIGIMTDSVRQFYPQNIVINNVEELPDRVIKELRHLLTSGK